MWPLVLNLFIILKYKRGGAGHNLITAQKASGMSRYGGELLSHDAKGTKYN